MFGSTRTSSLALSVLLTFAWASQAAAIEPVTRAYYGARYEPLDKIIHGAGQTYSAGTPQNMAFDYYSTLMGPARYPLTFMTYCSLGATQSWFASLKTRLEGYQSTKGQYVVPQIGLNLPKDSMPPGTYDTQLQNFCSGLKSLGRPVFIRVGYEVNGTWYDPMYQPEPFKSAYRRVVEKLRAESLPAAALWCMYPSWNDYYGSWEYMSQFYPGNDVVDWFCCDLFWPDNFTANDTKLFFDYAEDYGKPVIMGESTPATVGTGDDSDWATFFVPYFDLYYSRKGFKAHTYINFDWTGTQWDWGDCRLEAGSPYVRDSYLAQMDRSIWLHSGPTKPYIFPDTGSHNVDGIAMAMKSRGGVHDGLGWELTSNGYVGTFVSVETAGALSVTISADGQGAGGLLPEMHLHVGDEKRIWAVADNGASHTTYAEYTASFDLPAGTHCVRIEFVNRSAGSQDDRGLFIRGVSFGGTAHTVLNECTESNVLAASDTYIQNYRRGRAAVTLRKPDGSPLTEGTTVRAKLKKHSFSFGTSVTGLVENPELGSEQDRYQQFIASHFNTVVPESAGNWINTEPERGVVNMQAVDSILNYCQAHDLRVRMHSVQHAAASAEPDWVQTLRTQALSDPAAKQDYRDRISSRIQYYLRDRAGRYAQADGINESFHYPLNTQVFGTSGVAEIYNEMAAVTQDRARVFVNEFHVLNDPKDTSTSPATYDQYANWYRDHIQSIMDAGGVIGGIGAQAHTRSLYHYPPGDYRALQALSGFELPIVVSEFSGDAGSTDPMEDVLADSLRIAFGTDQVEGFVMWGFYEPRMSQGGSALVDEEWNLTASGTAYEQLMAEWTTDATAQVDSEGRVTFTGFYGDYEITVNGVSYPMKLEKGLTEYTIHTAGVGAPTAPDRLDAADVNTTSIRWTWRDNSTDETGFAVYADQGAAQPVTLRGTTAAEVTRWDYTGLTPNTQYSCQVSAVNAAGESARSIGLAKRTMAASPTYGGSGACRVLCDCGPGSPEWVYSPDQAITYNAVDGFGGGIAQAGMYLYIWNTSSAPPSYMQGARFWTEGSLSVAPGLEGAYYLHIWSCNVDGLVNSDCLTLGPYIAKWTCLKLKLQDAGSSVAFGGKVVSGVFSDRIYVQEPDGSSGICVKGSFAVEPGDIVQVSGAVTLDAGEAVIGTATVSLLSSGPEPAAVFASNRSLGGGAVGLQPATIDSAGPPVKLGTGLSPVGLLVRTTGKVTYVDPLDGYAYLDDASGLLDGSGHTGVRYALALSPIPAVGAQAQITGCLGALDIGGNCTRYVRPRALEDTSYSSVANWLKNSGFEQSVYDPWLYAGEGGALRTGVWNSVSAHTGSWFFGAYGAKVCYCGYLRQRVVVPAGDYRASVWSVIFHPFTADPEITKSRIGIDPTGGSDPGSGNVVWSEWDTTTITSITPWHQISTPTVSVSGGPCTVFLEYVQQDATRYHLNCFDDAVLAAP